MLTIESVTVDARDPGRLARFWAQLLGGWTVERDDDPENEVWISPPDGVPGPVILFGANDEAKTTKNRWHLDLRPDDQDHEVERAIELGATHVDIGQTGNESWVVLADPEGNEFCVLRATPRPTPGPVDGQGRVSVTPYGRVRGPGGASGSDVRPR